MLGSRWHTFTLLVLVGLCLGLLPPARDLQAHTSSGSILAAHATNLPPRTFEPAVLAQPVQWQAPTRPAVSGDSLPATTFSGHLLLPTYGATPGGVWMYSQGDQWELRNNGLPTGMFWQWIAASPTDPDTWLLLGNDQAEAGRFFRSPNSTVMTNGAGKNPLWITRDAGMTWEAVPLTGATIGSGQMELTQIEWSDSVPNTWAIAGQALGLQGEQFSFLWHGTGVQQTSEVTVAGLRFSGLLPGEGADLIYTEYQNKAGYIQAANTRIETSSTLGFGKLGDTQPGGRGYGFVNEYQVMTFSPDYRSTSTPLAEYPFIENGQTKLLRGNTLTFAGHGLYVGRYEQGAQNSAYRGIYRNTDLFHGGQTNLVVRDSQGIVTLRADRQSRTTVVALSGNSSAPRVYLSENGLLWGKLVVPQNVWSSLSSTSQAIEVTTGIVSTAQQRNPEDCGCTKPAPQPTAGRGINTRSGNRGAVETDLTAQTPGPLLSWTRSYANQAITEPQVGLGYGWSHTYATRIVTPTDVPGTLLLVSPFSNQLRFRDLGGGRYEAPAGVHSMLARVGDTYVQTLADQSQRVFDKDGRLQTIRDAQGRDVRLTYGSVGNPPQQRVIRVEDIQTPFRFLDIHYTVAGQIDRVSDGSRTVQYGYANGDLNTVTDVMGRTTTYIADAAHRWIRTENALGQAVDRTEYDPSGRAVKQVLQDGQILRFTYFPTATLVTTQRTDGKVDVDQFDYAANNTLRAWQRNGQLQQSVSFDASLQPSVLQDATGATTIASSTALGMPTEQVNALGETTRIEYDSWQRPTVMTDAMGRRTEFAYDSANNLIKQTTGITGPFLGFTTIYTYDVQYPGKHWLEQQRGPDGVVTRYEYNTQGQVITTTVGYGQPGAQVTAAEYDNVGRQTATIVAALDPALRRKDITIYNPDNTVAATVQNVVAGGNFTSPFRTENITTTYGYDKLGRQMWTRDALGHLDVTHYDAAGRIDWTVRNYVPRCIGGVMLVHADVPHPTPLGACAAVQTDAAPSYRPAYPDENVAVISAFDGLGHTISVTQTGIVTGTFSLATRTWSQATVRVAKTEYDDQGRSIRRIENYQGDGTFDPRFPDRNVASRTVYDAAGNVRGEQDGLGRWMINEYDALNRVITSTLNYEDGVPGSVAPGTTWTDGSDTDIMTVQRYGADGQVVATIQNYVDGVFDPAQPVLDRMTVPRYDALGRTDAITGTLHLASLGARTDTNLVTGAAYDAAGRSVAQQDVAGRWTVQQYDLLGRVNQTITNCMQGARPVAGMAAISPSRGQCDTQTPNLPDRNLRSSIRFDALWRPVETVDPLGHVRRTVYNRRGDVVQTVDNAVPGTVNESTSITTTFVSDVLGRTIKEIDPTGAAMRTGYDGLGQTSVITDVMGRVSRNGYDGAGQRRWSMTPDGHVTVVEVDGLGNVRRTITNYQDGNDANDGGLTDQDLAEQRMYDQGGREIVRVTADGKKTAFRYDLRDLPLEVVENAQCTTVDCATLSACPATSTDCTIVTRYTYDQAGNRLSLVDTNGHIRRWTYDAADRPVTAINALGHTTIMTYTVQGLLADQSDARGPAAAQHYGYDLLDRTIRISSPALTTPITTAYNELGWRMSMGDATGVTTFGYDAIGRMTSVNAPNTGTVRYGYTARGDRASLQYPNGPTLSYTYFADGQLQKVSQGLQQLATYTYDAAGRLATETRANGTFTTSTYDGAGRPVGRIMTAGRTQLARFVYTLSRTGQRMGMAETIGGQSRTVEYAYDNLDRLTDAKESPGTHFQYTYDVVGNRTDAWANGALTEHHDYNEADQAKDWSYDGAGNLINNRRATYVYDPLNRLTEARQGTSTSVNTYNADGILVAQAQGGTTTRFAQDLAAPLPQMLAATQGTATTTYLWGRDRLAAVSSLGRAWETHDAVGSVRQRVSDAGGSQAALLYDPWGAPETGTQVQTFGFAGEYQDGQSGDVYLRARWYQPSAARFTSVDPFPGWSMQPFSQHSYQYAYAQPMLLTDPSGRAVDPGQLIPNPTNPHPPHGSKPADPDSHGRHITRNWRSRLVLPYMLHELLNNVQSPVVQNARCIWLNASLPFALKLTMLTPLADKVRNHGEWDYKDRLDNELGLRMEKTYFQSPRSGNWLKDYWFPLPGDDEHEYYYTIWANLNFGYVTSYIGIASSMLTASKRFPSGQFNVFIGEKDAGDIISTEVGISLWNKFGKNITESSIVSEIFNRQGDYLRVYRERTGFAMYPNGNKW